MSTIASTALYFCLAPLTFYWSSITYLTKQKYISRKRYMNLQLKLYKDTILHYIKRVLYYSGNIFHNLKDKIMKVCEIL